METNYVLNQLMVDFDRRVSNIPAGTYTYAEHAAVIIQSLTTERDACLFRAENFTCPKLADDAIEQAIACDDAVETIRRMAL